MIVNVLLILSIVVVYFVIGVGVALVAPYTVDEIDRNDVHDMAMSIIGWPFVIFAVIGYGIAKLITRDWD